MLMADSSVPPWTFSLTKRTVSTYTHVPSQGLSMANDWLRKRYKAPAPLPLFETISDPKLSIRLPEAPVVNLCQLLPLLNSAFLTSLQVNLPRALYSKSASNSPSQILFPGNTFCNIYLFGCQLLYLIYSNKYFSYIKCVCAIKIMLPSFLHFRVKVLF